jgi:hypothetical protein
MKSLLLLLTLLVIASVGCQSTPRFAYSDSSGSSLQQAVVIEGATEDEALDKAERAWIARRYPGSRVERRSIRGIQFRHYSVIELTTTGGDSRTVYFDITDYFSHQ